MSKKAYLILENGEKYEGIPFGAEGEVISEIVFSTSMVGYIETLTDLSYMGQTVVQTFPLIGNYGIIPQDFESDKIGCKGYIVKSWCREPSNFRSEGNLDTFLKDRNIIGLEGIDTRALTKTLRDNGIMNGIITQNPNAVDLDIVKNYKNANTLSDVSTKKAYELGNADAKLTVGVLDFGLKKSMLNSLLRRNVKVKVFPYNTKAEELFSTNLDGLLLTNGPCNALDNVEVINNLKEIIKRNTKILALCLGHELLALANGFTIEKMQCGHRGSNQPVKNLINGRVYTTSQNHGYSVVSNSIDNKIAKEIFINVNDKTCEGILYLNIPAVSAQFQSEAGDGLDETSFLFDMFISSMEGK